MIHQLQSRIVDDRGWLRQRLNKELGIGLIHCTCRASWIREKQLHSRVGNCFLFVIGFATLLVLAVCGDRQTAKDCYLNLACLILQTGFLVRIYPAFGAYANSTRRNHLVFPVAASLVAVNWWKLRESILNWSLGLFVLLAASMLLCGVNARFVALELAWQVIVLAVSARIDVLLVSRAGNFGWMPAISFWTLLCFNVMGVMMLPAIDSSAHSVIFNPIASFVLHVPTWIDNGLGTGPAFVMVSVCGWAAIRNRRVPSRRIRRVSFAFRNLPDRETVALQNINYVHPPHAGFDAKPRQAKATAHAVGVALAKNRRDSDPAGNLDSARAVWWWSFAMAIAFTGVMGATDYFNWQLGSEPLCKFASGSILIHTASVIATLAVLPSTRSRLITTRDLMCMLRNGLIRDVLLAALILVPPTAWTISCTGDAAGPLTYSAAWLLAGVCLRFAWIPFAGVIFEVTNAGVAFWALQLSFIAMVCFGRILKLLLPQVGDLVWTLPVIVAVATYVYGWDRFAAWFQASPLVERVHERVKRLLIHAGLIEPTT